MKEFAYKVLQAITLAPGTSVIFEDENIHKVFDAKIAKAKDAEGFVVKETIQLKRGIVFVLKEALPKSLSASVEELDILEEPEPEKKPKADAKKDSKGK